MDDAVRAERRFERGQRRRRRAAAQPLVGDESRRLGDGTSCASKRAARRRPRRSARASARRTRPALPGEPPARGDELGADALVESSFGNSPPSGPRRSAPAPGPERPPAPRPEPSGTRVIDSTPPATTTSYCPAMTMPAAKSNGLLRRPAGPVHRDAGHRVGPARRQHRVAPHLRRLVADLVDAPPDDVVDRPGSMPVRSTSARRTCAERSTGWTSASDPFRLPIGVRTASTTTASGTIPPQVRYNSLSCIARLTKESPWMLRRCGPSGGATSWSSR